MTAEPLSPEQRAHEVATFLGLPVGDGIAQRVIAASIRAAETALLQPAAPVSTQATQVTQQIVDVVNAWQRERGETSILKRPDPTLAGYAAVGKIGRIVAGALEALAAENARLTDKLEAMAESQAYWRRMFHRVRERLDDDAAVEEIDGSDWYAAQRAKVEAEFAAEQEAKRSAWPRHCRSPSSCTRHGACMYMNCRHEGRDIRQAIANHAAAKDGE